MNEEIKYCKFCGKEKPIKDFVKSGFCVKNICKDCNNKKQKDVYKNSKNYHKLQQENQQLKEQLEEEQKDYDRMFALWHNNPLIKKFDDEYDEEDKKKNPNRDYAYTMPDAEEVYKRYYDLKERLEASERARKKVIYHIKNNVEDYEFENTEHYVEILDILDIDKGE